MTRTRLRHGPGRNPRRRLLRISREYIEPNSTDARTPVLLARNGIVVGSTASAGSGYPRPLPNSWRYWHSRGEAELKDGGPNHSNNVSELGRGLPFYGLSQVFPELERRSGGKRPDLGTGTYGAKTDRLDHNCRPFGKTYGRQRPPARGTSGQVERDRVHRGDE